MAGLGAGEVARRPLGPDEVRALVAAEIEQRRAAARAYADLGRPDRAERLRADADLGRPDRAEADVLAAHVRS